MDSDLIDINTNLETWVEVNGAQVIVKNPDGNAASAGFTADGRGGFSREIRKIRASRTISNSSKSTQGSNPYLSSPKWREASKFGAVLIKTLQALAWIILRRFISILPFDLPALPTWVKNLPRRVRLLWHGTSGEERRRVRLEEARQRREVQRQRAQSDQLFRERAEQASRALSTSTAYASSINANASNARNRNTATPSYSSSAAVTHWQRFFSQDFVEEDDDDEWQEERDDGTIASGLQILDDEGDDDDDDDDDDDGEEEGDGEDILGDGVEEEEVGFGGGDVSSELLNLAQVDFDGEETGRDSYTNVLMAHLSRPGNGALTRRGYQRLVGGQSQAEQEAQHLIDVIHQRRLSSNAAAAAATTDSNERERMRLCVICYIEDRTIICWPCKCLALCEGCREAMASRPPLRSHLDASSSQVCPTCRTPVVGFSRVYLP
jgi:hypothetical protein